MTTPRNSKHHHLYYSSHADPMENMLRAHTLKSKSSYNINQWPAVANSQQQQAKFGSRWTLAQPETAGLMQEKQDRKNNTYYNNMIMYINNKNGDNESTMSALKVDILTINLHAMFCNVNLKGRDLLSFYKSNKNHPVC